MCVESDGCEIEGCTSSDEVQTLSGSMSPGLKSNSDPHQCRTGHKFRAALLRCRSPVAAAGILSFGNVLNYMDRYTVAGVLLDIQQHFGVSDSGAGLLQTGVLLDIQQHFGVSDSGAGLLQTVFICSFMVAAPIFGYLGDRFNRKVILGCGIFFWSAVTLSSSFITKEYYWLFVLSRGLVGIGESSYSSISPTIIGDLFTNNTRTMMLSVFYFAIPLGSRSYVFSSLASAAVSFATGAFGMWIPLYLFRAQVVQKSVVACDQEPCSIKDSMLGSAIFICLIFVAAKKSIVGAYYVVIPTRRATAVALQSFTSHALGDAGSPYLIGLSYTESILWQFLSLGYALMLCPFVIVLGGMFFLATALFFLDDRDKAEKQLNQLTLSPSSVKV
ncbi:UNVERIFIED_CONTAM: hypothetical protein FKN15_019381 [Acipenser sinensis]